MVDRRRQPTRRRSRSGSSRRDLAVVNGRPTGPRVVAGEFKGRRLYSPPGQVTRPTGARVREAAFNALGSMDALAGARVVDLFAGTGALGFEALSRGAARVTFVEWDPGAIACLEASIDQFGVASRTEVAKADVLGWVGARSCDADLVLADPPYSFDEWAELMGGLVAPTLVAEAGHEVAPVEGWELVRSKAYGASHLSVLVAAGDVRPTSG